MEYQMRAKAIRLTEAKIKNAKAQEKDYMMGDGDGLQMRIRINGLKLVPCPGNSAKSSIVSRIPWRDLFILA